MKPMTFFLKYDVVSPKKIWGHLQTPLFTYKITYLAPLCRESKILGFVPQ